MFEVLREVLTTAAPAFPVLERVKIRFEDIVGAVNHAKASTQLLRKPDGVSPEEVAVGLHVPQDDVADAMRFQLLRQKLGTRCQSFGDWTEGRRVAFDGPQNPAQPVESLAGLGIVFAASEAAAQVTSKGAQLPTQPSLAKEPTQLVVPILKQVLADVAQEMEVASRHGDNALSTLAPGELGLLYKRLGRFRQGPAQVPHDRARRAEAEHDFPQPGKNDVSPFGGHFPGAHYHYPLTPAGEGHRQCAFKFLRQACRGRPRPSHRCEAASRHRMNALSTLAPPVPYAERERKRDEAFRGKPGSERRVR